MNNEETPDDPPGPLYNWKEVCWEGAIEMAYLLQIEGVVKKANVDIATNSVWKGMKN